MIVRPPQKRALPKIKLYSSLFQKVANDNQPPKRYLLGWIFLGLGIFLLITAFFWI